MYDISYELWLEMVERVASEYAPLFSIMHEAAREIPLSRALIEKLKSNKRVKLSNLSFFLGVYSYNLLFSFEFL